MHPRRPVLRTALLLALTCVHAVAAPTGGVVVSGTGGITTSGATTTVTQGSDRLSLNWATFNVGTAETVRFNQPSASSIAVNRIADVNGSRIQGNLQANGQVFLINPNGIIFGSTAQVNVGGLVASTLNISDADLANGTRRFSGSGTGAVSNAGSLNASSGGYIALLGGTVTNTGTLSANGGTVALGAGNRVALDFAGDRLVSLAVEENTVAAQAANGGLIRADGGQVLLSAGARDSLVASVVNNTGVIEARTVENRDGRIILLGGMTAGTTNVAGKLDASAPNGGNGGFIETSAAHVKVASSAIITTKATSDSGKTGTWLIDPQDFKIAASGGDITGAALAAQLVDNNVVIESAAGATDGNGDIFVNDTVSWSANQLTLSAERNIAINRNLNASGTASLALLYGQGAIAAGNTANYTIASGAKVNLPSGNSFSTQLGSDGVLRFYQVITTLGTEIDLGSQTSLQGIDGANIDYALGADIDASATSSWNNSAGFTPISFTGGSFAGLGHKITGLKIDRSSDSNVGLFSQLTNVTVRDLGLKGGAINGGNYVGGLVGYSDHSSFFNIDNANAVSGYGTVGGLVGQSQSSVINNVSNTGAVNANNSRAAGLVAYSVGDTITNSSNTGAIIGYTYVGGLVGNSNGTTLSGSYNTGAISGYYAIGGLAGEADYTTLTNVYNLGSISGSDAVGGLAGVNHAFSNLSNAYSSGAVAGSSRVGGVVGSNSGVSSVTNAYWDVETSGQSMGVGSDESNSSTYTGLTTAQARDASNYQFDFNSTWWAGGGGMRPILRSEYSTTITNAHQLQMMAMDMTANYTLAADIDATATSGADASSVWSTAGFKPIGDVFGTYFSGNFYGDGHIITGLNIDRPSENSIGLFGAITGSIVRDVGFVGGSVSGGNYVGGIIGYADNSTLTNLFNTRDVTSNYNSVGGLVGLLAYSSLSSAYNSGDISITSIYGSAGGLAGGVSDSTITNAYNTGAVSGTVSNYVGGLAGTSFRGDITHAYSTGSVTAISPEAIGGLIGYNYDSTLASSVYWNTETSTRANAIGVNASGHAGVNDSTGLTTAQLQDPTFLATSDWDQSVWAPSSAGYNPELYALSAIVSVDGGSVVYGEAIDTIGNITQGGPGSYVFGASGGNHVAGDTVLAIDGVNYRITGEFTVIARAITLTADNQTRVYGDANPQFTYSITDGSLINGDAFSGSLSSDADGFSGVGSYTIGVGTLSNARYTITFVDGSLEITQRAVTVAADNASRTYGDENSGFGYTVTEGALVNDDSFSGELGATADHTSNVGIYEVTQGTLGNANYAITFVGAELEVTQRTAYVEAYSGTRAYGDATPELNYDYYNVVNDDVFTGALSSTATVTSNVGTYEITQGDLALNSNYVIEFYGNNFEVTQRAVTVTADHLVKFVGAANPALTYSVTTGSVVNDDTFTGALATGAAVDSAIGDYGITQGDLALNSNYALTFIDGVLTVTEAPSEPAADADVKRAAQEAQSDISHTPAVNPINWGAPAPLELDFEVLPLPAGLTTASN